MSRLRLREVGNFESAFEKDYGSFASRADLFRRIGLDEREHKDASLALVGQSRFN